MDLEAAAAERAQAAEQPRQQQKGEIVFILNSMGGGTIRLEPMQLTATVRDLALQVRGLLSIPISVQNLIWGSQLLKDPSVQLVDVFGTEETEVNLTVLRRPFTVAERAELHKQLVRAASGGQTRQLRELLREGAPVDFDPDKEGHDTSISLSHWADEEHQDGEDVTMTRAVGAQGKSEQKVQEDEHMQRDSEDSQDSEEAEDSEDLETPWPRRRTATDPNWPTELTPLMMAIVAGDDDLAKDLRTLGAKEPDLTPKHQRLADAFQVRDFVDVVKHIANGADVNTRLRRGQGVQDTAEGRPLHACAALCDRPGSLEVAQLLLRKRADTSLGDSEGDNAMAHARYFGAEELYRLLEGHGAKLEGPFYSRFGM